MKPQKLISANKSISGKLFAACVLFACVAQLALAIDEQLLSVESREQKQDLAGDLDDPIKYLEKLDKFYSQIARPR